MAKSKDTIAAEKVPKAPKVKRARATSTKGHYITNAVLLPAVIRAKELGRVTDELAKMLLMIAERYSFKSNFGGYSFREDMVSFALINLCANALKFNPETSKNPFSYYTSAIHNSFLQYLLDEKDHRNIRDKLLIESGANASMSYMGGGSDDGAYDDHGEVAQSGYQDWNKPDIEPAPVTKSKKQLSGDAAYKARLKELGLMPKEEPVPESTEE